MQRVYVLRICCEYLAVSCFGFGKSTRPVMLESFLQFSPDTIAIRDRPGTCPGGASRLRRPLIGSPSLKKPAKHEAKRCRPTKPYGCLGRAWLLTEQAPSARTRSYRDSHQVLHINEYASSRLLTNRSESISAENLMRSRIPARNLARRPRSFARLAAIPRYSSGVPATKSPRPMTLNTLAPPRDGAVSPARETSGTPIQSAWQVVVPPA